MDLIHLTAERVAQDAKLKSYLSKNPLCALCDNTSDIVLAQYRHDVPPRYLLSLCRDCAHTLPARMYAKLGLDNPLLITVGGAAALESLRSGMMANFNAAVANELAEMVRKNMGPGGCECPDCQKDQQAKSVVIPLPTDLNGMLAHMGIKMPKKPKEPPSAAGPQA
jgi:hypothetical protein